MLTVDDSKFHSLVYSKKTFAKMTDNLYLLLFCTYLCTMTCQILAHIPLKKNTNNSISHKRIATKRFCSSLSLNRAAAIKFYESWPNYCTLLIVSNFI